MRAVLVRGSGNSFSYGLDLPAMLGGGLPGLFKESPTVADRVALLDTIKQLQGALTAVEACRKPVVAAVHGWCIGGGVGLIAACDVRLCSARRPVLRPRGATGDRRPTSGPSSGCPASSARG